MIEHIGLNLLESYQQMAQDKDQQKEALGWIEMW